MVSTTSKSACGAGVGGGVQRLTNREYARHLDVTLTPLKRRKSREEWRTVTGQQAGGGSKRLGQDVGFAFEATDHDGTAAISVDIDRSATHVEHAINGQQHAQTFER